MTKTSIGRRRDDDSLKVDAKEPHGYVLTGPLRRLAKGLYRLDVRCDVGTPKAPNAPEPFGLTQSGTGKNTGSFFSP